MIITQQIINGVCSVTKTGSYFNLISAGGVVRVKLTKNGSTVLDSKMWVGMNLDKAQPFDEVEIYGADGPIEFWAGEISMQHFAFGNNAARAIRSAINLIYGEKQIVGADLTRRAVRVRSNKLIYLGGAGFLSGGWRVNPGETVEIPVAGIVSAYKPPAFIDYTITTGAAEISGMLENNAYTNASVYLSHDNQTRIYNTANGGTLRYTTDGGASWQSGKTDVYGYEFDKRTGTHYLLQLKGGSSSGSTVVFSRSADGIEWEQLYHNYNVWPQGANTGYTEYRAALVGKWMQRTFSGMTICCDIETGRVIVTENSINGATTQQGKWLDDDLRVGIFGTSNELYRTEDAGESWQLIAQGYYNSSFNVDADGSHLFASINSRPHVSEDGGFTWVQCGSSSWNGKPTCHIAGNLWVSYIGGIFKYVDMPKGPGSETTGNIGAASINVTVSQIFIKPDGTIYTARVQSDSVIEAKISIEGDVSSARVEVMELLA
ncbi:hypothetical protein [Shewanella algae]